MLQRSLLAVLLGALLVGATALMGGVSGATDPAPDSGDPAGPTDAQLPHGVKVDHELPKQRTATSRTYVTDSGQRMTKLFLEPVNYKDAHGDWQKIDTRLKSDSTSALTTTHTGFDLSVPKTLDSGSVRVDDAGDVAAFSLKDAQPAAAKVDGSTAHFANALPSVDTDYTATSDAIKETLSLKDANAAPSYAFNLRLSDGLTPKQQKDGSIALVDKAGAQQMIIPAPTIADAKGETTDKVGYDIAPDGDNYTLTLKINKDWLADAKREYPIKVDPSLYTGPLRDCTIKSATPTTSYCSAATNEVGTSAGSESRTLYAFDIESAIPKGARIEKSWLYQSAIAKASSASENFGVYRLTRPFSSSATWNSATTGTPWTTAGGDAAATAYNSHPINGASAVPYDDYYYPLTKLLQEWRDGTQPDYGFMIKGDGSTQQKLTSDSMESTNPANRPYIGLYWDYRPGAASQFTELGQQLSDRMGASVNPANGNLTLQAQDLHLDGTTLDLNIGRAFNGLSDFPDVKMGPKWQLSLSGVSRLLTMDGDDKLYIDGSGAGHLFTRTSDTTYSSPTGINATLTHWSTGRKLTFDKSGEKDYYNSDGDLTKQEDRNGNAITYTYTSPGKLTSIQDTRGQTTSVTYDGSGRIQKITDPTARYVTYGYDSSGRLSSYTDAAGKNTTYSYDSAGNLSQITDPRGIVTRIEYDTTNRVTDLKRNYSTSNGTYTARSHYAYAAADATCNAVDITKTVVTDPDGHATTYCFDTELRADKVTDAKGRVQSDTYNANSDVTQTVNGSATSHQSYDSATNDLKTADAPAGEHTELEYNGTSGYPHQPTRLTNPQGSKLDYAYSANGDLTGVTNGVSPTQIQGRLEYNGTPTGTCTNDPSTKPGTLRCAIDGNGNKTTYGYDSQGKLTTITPPTGIGQTTRTYDSAGRLRTSKDGKNQTTTYSYDAMDRTKRIDFDDGSYVTLTYDDDGNQTSRTDSTNGTTSWAYDNLNRRTTDTLPTSNSTTYTWDAASNLASIADQTGTTSYGYDETNQLATLTEPEGTQTTFGYDSRDNRTTTNFPNNVVETRTYDLSDKPLSIFAKKTGASAPLTDFTYTYTDASTHQTELAQTMKDKSGQTVTYGYDTLDRLTSATPDSHPGPNPTATYTYDAASNKVKQTVNSQTTSYGFNASNQMCWSVAGTVTPSATPCASTPSGARTYSYDANGNRTGNSNGGVYTYNARNQMTTDKQDVNATTTTQTYQGAGQGELTSSGSYTLQNNLLGVGVVNGDIWGRYDVRREPSGALFSSKQGSDHVWLLQDALGSPVSLATTSGTSAGDWTYGPWGDSTETGQTSANFFRFAGAFELRGEFLHYGQRYYDPATNNWTQPDPLDHAGDLNQANRYQYAADNPVNQTDLSGEGIFSWGEKVVKKNAKKVFKKVFKKAIPANGLACYIRKSVGKKDDNTIGDDIKDAVNCVNPLSGYVGDLKTNDDD